MAKPKNVTKFPRRKMRDSTNVGAIPRRTRMVAAYINGSYANYAEAKRRFRHVESISVTGVVEARFYDVEQGDYTAMSPDLIRNLKRDKHNGHLSYVYTSLSNLPAVKLALRGQGLLEWQADRYWIAWYQKPPSTKIPPEGRLVQYLAEMNGSPGHYDESVLRFYCPGIDSPSGFRATIYRLRRRLRRARK